MPGWCALPWICCQQEPDPAQRASFDSQWTFDEQWMQNWVWRECKLSGNYSHPLFWPSILKLKMQHKNNTVFAADSTDCRALWKHVGVCFLLFSLLLADRIGEEVELQISFLLFCCLWSLPTESTLTKSRTLRLMLNWVNKLCMKLCRSL